MRHVPIYEYFVFNGRSSLDFGVRISGLETYKTAERDTESVEIPGRNGDLTIDNGRYKNVKDNYDSFIISGFEEKFSEFANFMTQDSAYHRLWDTYHPDEYRMAKFIGPLEPDVFMNESGSFSLEFDRMPQRWLRSGEDAITIRSEDGTVTLRNPTYQAAMPLITVTKGTGLITVNDQLIQVNRNNGATVINSEIEDCYEGSENRNGDVEMQTRDGEYPALKPGVNKITVSSGMAISLIPRWWKL